MTPATHLRFALIDDDADHRQAVVMLLNGRGIHGVTQASNADEGVELATEHQPDVILLDLAMPGRTGIEVLPQLREAAPKAAVVVLSNLSRSRLLGLVLKGGAVGFIEKSVAPDRLVDEILVAAMLTDLANTYVLELRAEPESAGRARRFMRELLTDADQPLLADVQLIVSELVTNAVLHASSEPRLEVHLLPDRIRIEAHDDDSTMPVVRELDPGQAGGLGLHLVARLSSRWGVETRPNGKGVGRVRASPPKLVPTFGSAGGVVEPHRDCSAWAFRAGQRSDQGWVWWAAVRCAVAVHARGVAIREHAAASGVCCGVDRSGGFGHRARPLVWFSIFAQPKLG